jgi:hypothetical protein
MQQRKGRAMRGAGSGQYLPGKSGNPAGRPKGARDKMHACIDALCADWAVRGKDAIRELREEQPLDYIRVIIAMLPHEIRRQAWRRYHGR